MIFAQIREQLGEKLGYGLGIFTGSVSHLRNARVFHPSGVLLQASVTPSDNLLGKYALIRFSAALWKYKRGEKESKLPDVLGCAIRFTSAPPEDVHPQLGDQDLLFATIRSPWTMPFSPFWTRAGDYLDNLYFAVSPFDWGNLKLVYFRLRPNDLKSQKSLSREEKLSSSLKKGVLHLEYSEKFWFGKMKWKQICILHLEKKLDLDQEELRFSPFRESAQIQPRGLVHFLRKGAYGASQAARPKTEIGKEGKRP